MPGNYLRPSAGDVELLRSSATGLTRRRALEGALAPAIPDIPARQDPGTPRLSRVTQGRYRIGLAVWNSVLARRRFAEVRLPIRRIGHCVRRSVRRGTSRCTTTARSCTSTAGGHDPSAARPARRTLPHTAWRRQDAAGPRARARGRASHRDRARPAHISDHHRRGGATRGPRRHPRRRGGAQRRRMATDVGGVAVAIIGADGIAVAALGLSGPIERIMEQRDEMSEALRRATDQLRG